MSKRGSIAALALVALMGVACGGDDAGDTPDPGGEANGAVTLTASNFAFQPTSLSAPAGGTIEFTNEDDAEHSFTADEAGMDVDVKGGESVSVDVGDAEPGSYEFYCKYHKDSMTGTLEITG